LSRQARKCCDLVKLLEKGRCLTCCTFGLCQRTRLRDVLVRYAMHVGHVAEVARPRTLLLGLHCWKIVRCLCPVYGRVVSAPPATAPVRVEQGLDAQVRFRSSRAAACSCGRASVAPPECPRHSVTTPFCVLRTFFLSNANKRVVLWISIPLISQDFVFTSKSPCIYSR
jgi:hypothetical protein